MLGFTNSVTLAQLYAAELSVFTYLLMYPRVLAARTAKYCRFLLYFHQGSHEDYISKLHTFFHLFVSTTEMKLAMLEFLCCREFVKNSNRTEDFFEFYLNCTKLAPLPTWSFAGKSKLNSAKEIIFCADRTQNLFICTLKPLLTVVSFHLVVFVSFNDFRSPESNVVHETRFSAKISNPTHVRLAQ